MKKIANFKNALPNFLSAQQNLSFDEISNLVKVIEFMSANSINSKIVSDFLEYCTFEIEDMTDKEYRAAAEEIQQLPKTKWGEKERYIINRVAELDRERWIKP